MGMNKEHTHNYVAESYTVQEHVNAYQGSAKYATAIISKDKAYIFCTTCGDIKHVEELEKEN